METKKPDPTEELLCEIYRNVQMGTESVADVIPKIEDKRLLTDATSEIECYGRYTSEAAGMMNDRGIRPQQLAAHKKLSAKMGIAMNTLVDSSSGHIAEMLIEGNHMGADQLDGEICKCEKAGCDSEVSSFARRVVAYERSEAERLKSYL
ncbi:MAG: hypothetical protein MJ088_01685 [Clostridia bacterium]|nr:hypothetical protein [Clostridia bacterium]